MLLAMLLSDNLCHPPGLLASLMDKDLQTIHYCLCNPLVTKHVFMYCMLVAKQE